MTLAKLKIWRTNKIIISQVIIISEIEIKNYPTVDFTDYYASKRNIKQGAKVLMCCY